MTDLIIKPKPITKENFKKFGDMITTADIKPIEINNGYAKRYDGNRSSSSNLSRKTQKRDKFKNERTRYGIWSKTKGNNQC